MGHVGVYVEAKNPDDLSAKLNFFQQSWSSTDAMVHARGCSDIRRICSAWPNVLPRECGSSWLRWWWSAPLGVRDLHRRSESTHAYLRL